MTSVPPAQRILEEQGYIVGASPLPIKIGTILPGFQANRGWAAVEGPLVVVGAATKEDLFRQQRQFGSGLSTTPEADLEGYFFYKVAAE